MEENILRHAVKGIIIKDNKLLVESCDYGRGRFSKLPGGGHQWGETMIECLVREIKEELGLDATPKKMLFARDYIAKNHNTTIDEPYFHLSELIFECEIDDFSKLGTGCEPDGGQEIKWIALDELESSDFVPKAIIPYLNKLSEVTDTIVLGDAN